MNDNGLLEFECKLHELEQVYAALERQSAPKARLVQLQKKIQQERHVITALLKNNTWHRVQVARHVQRPRSSHYIQSCFDSFYPLSGDHVNGYSPALRAGIAQLSGQTVMLIAQQKGHDLESNLACNFGMLDPGGYRSAQRLMRLAQKLKLPLITLLDSPGADAGVAAEKDNQCEAIAKSLLLMSQLETPIISLVIGEAMSGGAIALGVADCVAMLQYSIYSVISPEGCASILWRDSKYSQQAAENLQLTADAMLQQGLIDDVITEPLGGAHRDRAKTAEAVKAFLQQQVASLTALPIKDLLLKREKKWRKIGLA